MPRVMCAVEKEGTFQGRTERWSNVYCYEVANFDATTMQALEDAVLAAERPVHSSAVTFKQTKTYTVEGLNTLDSGTMKNITERNVAGTGSNSGTGSMYKECAVLVKWPLPRKQIAGVGVGRQRSLKKWIHPFGPLSFTSEENQGVSAIGTTGKAPFLTYAAAVRTPTGGALISPSDGAEPNQTAIVHPYIEHRQFPRGRKED